MVLDAAGEVAACSLELVAPEEAAAFWSGVEAAAPGVLVVPAALAEADWSGEALGVLDAVALGVLEAAALWSGEEAGAPVAEALMLPLCGVVVVVVVDCVVEVWLDWAGMLLIEPLVLAAPLLAEAPLGLLEAPCCWLQFSEIMFTLLTCRELLPLDVPLIETVWPTCGVSCEASADCSDQVWPFASVRLKLPAEPCRQPVIVWLPEELAAVPAAAPLLVPAALPWVAPCAPPAVEDGFCSGLLGLVVCVWLGVVAFWSGVLDWPLGCAL